MGYRTRRTFYTQSQRPTVRVTRSVTFWAGMIDVACSNHGFRVRVLRIALKGHNIIAQGKYVFSVLWAVD